MSQVPRFYRWLLGLYPAGFREEYQTPMEQQFHDDYADAAGSFQRAGVWLRAIADIVVSAPQQLMRELWQDLRYSVRLYRHRAGTALFAIVALSLAIGASTAIFSVLNALLLRGLPFSNPDELVRVWNPPTGVQQGRAAFEDWYRHHLYLAGAAACSPSEMNLSGRRTALRVQVAETTANFFDLLGTRVVLGRTFAAGEEVPGRSDVAVISHALWQQWFGGDLNAIGATLRLDGTAITVVGIAPPQFDYPGKTSIWTPSIFGYEMKPKRGAFVVNTIGRLKPGVSLGQVRSLTTAAVTNGVRLTSIRDELAGSIREATWVLAALILVLLGAACVNVAQLLLSRTTERRRELAVRSALGASRARMIQQLVTEATALTSIAAALGLLVAHWAAQLAATVAPAPLASQDYTILDWRVVAFAAALMLSTGLVFGVVPAWFTARGDAANRILRTSGGPESSTRRMRSISLGAQAALAFVLLTSTFTLGRAFLKLLHTDLGLRPANVATLSVSLQGSKYRSGTSEWQYYSEAISRVRTVPGVESAGAVSYLPLANNLYMMFAFKLDSGQPVSHVVVNSVTPDYFRSMGTRIVSGRDFRPGETDGVVIVNDAFAEASGLGNAIVGRRILTPWNGPPNVVAGIAETTRFGGPAYAGTPQIYWPVQQEPPAALTVVAKTRGDAAKLLPAVRQAVQGVDRDVPVYDAKTLNQRLAETLARPKFYTTAILFLTAGALLLAAVGIYGSAAYSVAQRKAEIGLRMALGASYSRIRWMVVNESVVPIACGIVIGLAGSLEAGAYLEHLVVGAQALDLTMATSAAGLLLAGGAVTAWFATMRVLAIAPADALRAE